MGGGSVSSLANGLEELFDRPIVDGLVVGSVGGAEHGVGDGGAEFCGDRLRDRLLDPDYRLVTGVEALRFVDGVRARGDLGRDGLSFALGRVVGLLFVVGEDVLGGGHVG